MNTVDESKSISQESGVLVELKQIRRLLSELIGTSDLPAKEKFSREAISKAVKEYRKLSIERGEWIAGHDISKVIKHANYNSAKLIVEQFNFKNHFKRGHTYYFKKKDLIDLGKELKRRNINLEKYDELLRDKEKSHKYIESILLEKGSKTKRRFKIPEGLRDVFSQPYSAPTEELVRKENKLLMDDYDKFNLSEYVDLFDGKTYAMFKYDYGFDRYLKPEIKKYCKDWCSKFNYAQAALKRIIELKND
jgi:hypothetical protein